MERSASANAGANAGANARHRSLQSLVAALSAPPPPPPTPHALAEIYLASLGDSTLGYATNLHLAWVDKYLSLAAGDTSSVGRGGPKALWERQPAALARLLRVLVDAAKTGDAPPIPDALRGVAYPHYLVKDFVKGGGRGGGGTSTDTGTATATATASGSRSSVVHSRSAVGLIHDDAAAFLAAWGRGGDLVPGGGEGVDGLTPYLVGLAVSAPPPPPRLSPHPLLVAASDAAGWRRVAPLAAAHLNAFIADCSRGLGGGGATDGGTESYDSAFSDGNDEIEKTSYQAARARARRRLERTREDSAAPFRTPGDIHCLALAYYRVAWARFSMQRGSRSEPHAFPWVVVGEELVAAAAAEKEKVLSGG